MNVIVNSGNPSYFETRALEFISEAQVTRSVTMRQSFKGVDDDTQGIVIENYKEELISAIRMLVVAILKVEDGEF